MTTNKYPFKEKVVIITGASSGIGEACALEFASKGAKIVLAARNIEKLSLVEKTITEKGGDVISVVTDVRKEKADRGCAIVLLICVAVPIIFMIFAGISILADWLGWF